MKKRMIMIGAVAAFVLAGAFSATVFAGGFGRNEDSFEEYPLCTVETCTQAGCHTHDGRTYSPHHQADGHEYHNPTSTYQGICPIESCNATGNHAHNGGIYGQHHNEDGHTYHGQQRKESSNGCHKRGGHH